ncbi:metal-dependent transcriptional regulator [Clostridium drakei]|uniref:DtxR family transcriptional regulator n=1 Tax=Clostridium drakei TaxID=332101 RepID=A0A2U8DS27_9CLOT|nr:metal-dependent transcriptional regulator [Clostridium drakei]AWI05556.1 DtxR family transcriptional regulator [Clostridium drakei]
MKIQESAENYLETILILQNELNAVRSIDIVNELNYTKASVSIAMKKLRENGYIEMDRDGYISLTNDGLAIAEKMYERHKALSSFLMLIGVNKKVALEDACRIEHVISDESFDKIKKYIITLSNH